MPIAWLVIAFTFALTKPCCAITCFVACSISALLEFVLTEPFVAAGAADNWTITSTYTVCFSLEVRCLRLTPFAANCASIALFVMPTVADSAALEPFATVFVWLSTLALTCCSALENTDTTDSAAAQTSTPTYLFFFIASPPT